jgi:DUF4097 and DUF4098 domain-containing protein YvlB
MNLKMNKTMKTKLLNYKYPGVFIFLAISLSLTGQVYENSRAVREAYKIAPSVEVQVINKYGDIHLVPWEKDSVVFEIDFSVISNKQSKVDKIFDYVDFDFKATAYYVIAQTVFEGQNTIWSEMADVAGTIFSSGTTTRIDYTVYFPAHNAVKVENKFGNLYTTDHTGKVDIRLSNGDMKAHSLTGPTRLNIEFGNVSIDEIASATVTLGYAEINLDRLDDVTFESRSSKIYLNNAKILHLDSRRDRYYIKSLGELSGESFFSYLSIDNVTSKINLKTNYGDVKIMDVSDTFQQMDFNSQYSDLSFFLDQDHFFDFDITRDDRSSVISSTNVISKKEDPVAGVEKTFRASVTAGKAGKQRVPVIVNIKSGKIYLMGS